MSVTKMRILLFAIIFVIVLIFILFLSMGTVTYSYSEFNVCIEKGYFGSIYLEKNSSLEYFTDPCGQAIEIPIDYGVTGIHFNFTENEFELKIGNYGEYNRLLSGETYAIPLGSSVFIRKKSSTPLPTLYTVEFYSFNSKIDTQYIETNNSAIEPSRDLFQVEGYTFVQWEEDFSCITQNITINAIYTINTYSVCFYVDEVLIHQQKTDYNTKIDEFVYIKPLYISTPFLDENGIQFDFNTNITQNITLTATTFPNFYNIDYYIGTSHFGTTQIEKKSLATAKIAPNITNDTFIGWQKLEANQNFDFEQPILQDTILYALYESDLIEVSFDLDGGSCNGEVVQMVKKGFTASSPTNVIKEGYTFIKWDTCFDNIIQPILIKAIYEKNTYTLRYFIYDTEECIWDNIDYGTTLENFLVNFIIADCDEFLYWHNGDDIPFSLGAPITNNLDLYCKTTKKTFDIVCHFLEKTSTTTLEYGSQLLRPNAPPCDIGHCFDDWYSDIDLFSPFIFNGLVSEEKHLYGNQKLISLDIVFDLHIDEIDYSSTTTIQYNEVLPSPQTTLEGYNISWYEDTQNPISFNFSKNIVSDTIIYGKATPKLYNISFDCNDFDGINIENETFYYLQEIILPIDINRYGYIFDGFMLNESPFILEEMPSHDITLIPTFSLRTFTLTFDCADSLSGLYTSIATLPTPQQKEWHYFDGWLDSEDLQHNGSYEIKGNMNFIAKYTKIRILTIHFLDSTIICKYGDEIDIPIPEKTNFVFLGWYRDELYENPYKNFATVESGDDLQLYAKWIDAQQTITLCAIDITDTIDIPYGELSTDIEPINIDGYSFKGWFLDKSFSLIYENSFLTEDITVYGRYEKMIFTVDFLGLNNKIIFSEQVAYMNNATPPTSEKLTEEGFVFDKFRDSFCNITKDTIIYCDYEKIRIIYLDHNGNETVSDIIPEKEGFIFLKWQLSSTGNVQKYTPVFSPVSISDIENKNLSPIENNQPSGIDTTIASAQGNNNIGVNQPTNNDSSSILGRLIRSNIYIILASIFLLLCVFSLLKNRNNKRTHL